MKRLLLFFIATIFLLSLVSSEQFFKGQSVDIRVPVRVNGYPSSSLVCNITVFNPNGVILVSFKQMTNDYTNTKTHNYTLPSSNTSQIGTYCSDITCTDGLLNATESYCFDVNNAGKDYSTEEALTYILVLAVLLILLGICLFGAIKLPYENPRGEWGEILHINYKKYGKIFCIGMSYVFLVWIVFIIWNLCYAFLQLQALNLFLKYLFYILLGFALPIFVVGVIGTIIIYTRERKIIDAINRGLTIK